MVSVLVRMREEELNPRASQGFGVQVGKQSEVLNSLKTKDPIAFQTPNRETAETYNVGFIQSKNRHLRQNGFFPGTILAFPGGTGVE